MCCLTQVEQADSCQPSVNSRYSVAPLSALVFKKSRLYCVWARALACRQRAVTHSRIESFRRTPDVRKQLFNL